MSELPDCPICEAEALGPPKMLEMTHEPWCELGNRTSATAYRRVAELIRLGLLLENDTPQPDPILVEYFRTGIEKLEAGMPQPGDPCPDCGGTRMAALPDVFCRTCLATHSTQPGEAVAELRRRMRDISEHSAAADLKAWQYDALEIIERLQTENAGLRDQLAELEAKNDDSGA